MRDTAGNIEVGGGGGVSYFLEGVREKGGSSECPEPPLVTGLVLTYSYGELNCDRLHILITFIYIISPLHAYIHT